MLQRSFRRRLCAGLLALLVLGPAEAATPPAARSPDELVTVEEALQLLLDDALAANLELRAGNATVAQRLAALDQARARFLPSVDLLARYSRADGGRTIEFPVGDLLNPVYDTLDELLQASGQPARFPTLQNQEIPLLREQEQETKLFVAQPLYEPRLGPAVEASRQAVDSERANLAALRSRVVRDTAQAYYQWLATQRAVEILEATRELAQANLDTNESLYRNGRITRDLVFRAEADLLEVEQQRLAATGRVAISRSYVNLLRNAPLTSGLPASQIDEPTVQRFRERFVKRIAGRQVDLEVLQGLASRQRAELASLDAAVAVGEAQQDLARAAFKPTLALTAEAGMQGEDYGFGDDQSYVLASVILRWNAFRGGADQAALREARALTDELRATRDLAGQQVSLEVQEAVSNLEVADASLGTAVKRTEAAEGAFRIASRKRDLGQINQAEFIDARRALTEAQLNLTRVRAEFLARLAELEYAVGDARPAGMESIR